MALFLGMVRCPLVEDGGTGSDFGRGQACAGRQGRSRWKAVWASGRAGDPVAVYVLEATPPLPPISSPPARCFEKTRVGGLKASDWHRIRGRAASSRGPHWANSLNGRGLAADALDYYDPSIGRYLQPEPMLQRPGYVASLAGRGAMVSAYS